MDDVKNVFKTKKRAKPNSESEAVESLDQLLKRRKKASEECSDSGIGCGTAETTETESKPGEILDELSDMDLFTSDEENDDVFEPPSSKSSKDSLLQSTNNALGCEKISSDEECW